MTADRTVAVTPGEIYQTQMVPAIFARWAPDLVAAAQPQPGDRVLDIAAALARSRACSTSMWPLTVGSLVSVRVLACLPQLAWRLKDWRSNGLREAPAVCPCQTERSTS